MTLDRAAILAAPDLPLTELDVEEWGGTIYLRPFTAGDLARLDTESNDPGANAAMLVILSVTDSEGEPLFTEDDVEAVKAKSLSALNRVAQAVNEINGLGDDSGN